MVPTRVRGKQKPSELGREAAAAPKSYRLLKRPASKVQQQKVTRKKRDKQASQNNNAEKKIRKRRKKDAAEEATEHEEKEEAAEEATEDQEKEEAAKEATEDQEKEEEAIEEAMEEQEREDTHTAESEQKMKKARKEEAIAEPEEYTSERKKKRVTPLLRATSAGLVAKAQRPFAMYCKEKGLRVQDASKGWKALSLKEKNVYIEKSKDSFLQQRRESAAAGVTLRKTQLECTSQDKQAAAQNKLLKSMNKKGPFASFCEDTGQNVVAATRKWKSMTKAQKASYVGFAGAEALSAMPGQDEDLAAEQDWGFQIYMQWSRFVNSFLKLGDATAFFYKVGIAGSLHGCSAQSNCCAQLL